MLYILLSYHTLKHVISEYICPNILSANSRLLQGITLVASEYRPTDAINMCGLLAAIFSPESFQHNDLMARSNKKWGYVFGMDLIQSTWVHIQNSTMDNHMKLKTWWCHNVSNLCNIPKMSPFVTMMDLWKGVFEGRKKGSFSMESLGLSCTEAFDSIMANRLGIALQNWWFWGDVCVCVCRSEPSMKDNSQGSFKF